MRTKDKTLYHFEKDDMLLFQSNKIEIKALKKSSKKNSRFR